MVPIKRESSWSIKGTLTDKNGTTYREKNIGGSKEDHGHRVSLFTIAREISRTIG